MLTHDLVDPANVGLATVVQALGDERRLAVFVAIRKAKALTTPELVARFADRLPASTLAGHLSALRRAGLVQTTKRGKTALHSSLVKRGHPWFFVAATIADAHVSDAPPVT